MLYPDTLADHTLVSCKQNEKSLHMILLKKGGKFFLGDCDTHKNCELKELEQFKHLLSKNSAAANESTSYRCCKRCKKF